MFDTTAVTFEHVTVQYENFLALDDINIAIDRRDFVGIIGPNGGGKTTMLRAILGLVRPRSGSIKIFGQPANKMRSLIGYVPQVTRFDRFYPIEIWDVVIMGRLTQSGLFRRYSKTDKEHAREALNLVGLYDSRFRQLGKLSGGQIQRVIVARALAGQPEILLLDEPTTSIDIQTEQNLYDLLHQLNDRMAIIMVSHDIGAISSHVKSIACLNRRLFHHGSKELTPEVIESLYGCPVDLIAHGTPHRVLPEHPNEEAPNV